MTKRVRNALTASGFALLYGAAFFSFVALVPVTCTGGSADSLMIGLYSLVLSIAGVLCVYFAKPPQIFYLAAIPLLPIAYWQLRFTFRLGNGYFFGSNSACEAIMEYEFVPDGRELFFLALWVSVNIVLLAGLAITFYRSRHSQNV